MKTVALTESINFIVSKVCSNSNSAVLLKKAITTALVLAVLTGCKKDTESIAVPQEKASQAGEDEAFSIAILPDTQYYTSLKHGGTMEMFEQQIQWVRDNKRAENIVYVVHLGDVVDHGDDDNAIEWERAKTEMYKLEEDNIPYGIAVGNHDQTPYGNPGSPGTNSGYGVYFGRKHMETKPWYGGAYGSSNNSDNHYDLFSANGEDFIVLYLEFNSPGHEKYSSSIENAVMNWADEVLNTYASRKAIIVSHSLLDIPSGSNSNIKAGEGDNLIASDFTNQGDVIYDRMKHHDNVFLMLGGHISGEGFRRDVNNGHVIKSYLADYQSRESYPYDGSARNAGNGLMRLMTFNKTQQTLSVRTFAPRSGGAILFEKDGDSEFTMPLYD
ncbi:metallophosphoesterase [Pontibacter silvestris]|uniref:Metallophosphoesterase n=1 Tax=Pontibacter silvestris TaxID=2305183 RepID=A0ABW4X1Z9_9BACT|nr:metallophosphoesterase [Pontibacter silvestris]MCC9138845.1 metallophosphoesterase [Pontibacter silvestris]